MKLIIFSVLCTFLGGAFASSSGAEGSNCAALAKISADLDNASTYFSQINSSDKKESPGQLALELIEGLNHIQDFMKDIYTVDLTSYSQLKPLQLIIPAIQNGLKNQVTELEKELATGQVDDSIRARIDSLSKSLALATSKLNDGKLATTCDLNEHVKLDVMVSYLCNIAIALEIVVNALNIFGLLDSVQSILQLICILRP
ncbi:hypothetical protein N7456_012128 [Penicillium angulare]|uniref:Cell wall galactomannoprotein n=1 Tax=Penicillium angulare TaxID=116970 RepID=A0A9W9EUY3_9EURO|nr:hypothetical protein N7456_012128 [Penicillium angulare]